MDNLTIKSLIVVPSVVGSSPIIHPKDLAFPAGSFFIPEGCALRHRQLR